MLTRASGLLLMALMLAPDTASARVPTATSMTSTAAEPVQFYVFSFTATPVADAARDVVVSALGYELEVDPAIEDGIVTFFADGLYSGPALLQDFGTALLDQDIALIRTRPGAYALVPRANVPALIARGGVLMALPSPAVPTGSARVVSESAPVAVYGRARWWDGAMSALLLFFAGASAGAGALLGGQTIYRRSRAAGPAAEPLLRLTDQRQSIVPSVDAGDGDPDLVIPRFETRPPL